MSVKDFGRGTREVAADAVAGELNFQKLSLPGNIKAGSVCGTGSRRFVPCARSNVKPSETGINNKGGGVEPFPNPVAILRGSVYVTHRKRIQNKICQVAARPQNTERERKWQCVDKPSSTS